MTDATSIARPYTKAAFSVAKSAQQLPLWSKTLNQLSLAVKNNDMAQALKNPKYTKQQLSELLIDFLHKIAGNGSQNGFTPIENFIRILAENKRLAILPNIAELFEVELAKESGYLSLVVTSAFEMDDQKQKFVTEKLSRQLNSALEIQFQVDPGLMGGLLVRSGNWVLDGTVKGQIRRLKSALI